ncbi:MAG: UbiA family prenyltransferase [Planctomycetes bacterium]|nr:UbiA family prenyltransferase [Planctomycetota bacterium]
MKHLGHTLAHYAQLSRLSNLPTCITNVLVGVAIGSAGGTIPWRQFTIIALAVSLFYIAGMALNDLVDAEQDRLDRPDRPIPSGKITKRAARNFVLFTFSLGVTLLVIRFPGTTVLTALLVASIVLYDLTHKKWAGSVVLMGACRGLVYLVGAHAVAGDNMNSIMWRNAFVLAGVITFYIMCITIVARGENKDHIDGRRWLSVLMPVVVCLSGLFIKPSLESSPRAFY